VLSKCKFQLAEYHTLQLSSVPDPVPQEWHKPRGDRIGPASVCRRHSISRPNSTRPEIKGSLLDTVQPDRSMQYAPLLILFLCGLSWNF